MGNMRLGHGTRPQVTMFSLWAAVGRKQHPPSSMTTLSFLTRGAYVQCLTDFEDVRAPGSCCRCS